MAIPVGLYYLVAAILLGLAALMYAVDQPKAGTALVPLGLMFVVLAIGWPAITHG